MTAEVGLNFLRRARAAGERRAAVGGAAEDAADKADTADNGEESSGEGDEDGTGSEASDSEHATMQQ